MLCRLGAQTSKTEPSVSGPTKVLLTTKRGGGDVKVTGSPGWVELYLGGV